MTDPGPAVSFVVLCYNFERFIGECLESILRQTARVPFEVVILDDASTDGSVAEIERFSDPRLCLVRHEKNRGHAASINEALRLTQAPIVARIDGDDRYRPEFLERMLPVFREHPEVVLGYADSAMIDEDGLGNGQVQDQAHHGRDALAEELLPLLEQNFICAPTLIGRREAWLGVPPVPEHLSFHDSYFTILMARMGPFFFRAEVLADYRIHSRNLHSEIARNGREEASVFWLLEQVFSTLERTPDRERKKQEAKSRIFGRRFREFGDKYFWFGLNEDALRCYRGAVRNDPRNLLNLEVVRRSLACAIGRERYERTKALFSRMRKRAVP